jgi:hypothetical protein
MYLKIVIKKHQLTIDENCKQNGSLELLILAGLKSSPIGEMISNENNSNLIDMEAKVYMDISNNTVKSKNF